MIGFEAHSESQADLGEGLCNQMDQRQIWETDITIRWIKGKSEKRTSQSDGPKADLGEGLYNQMDQKQTWENNFVIG